MAETGRLAIWVTHLLGIGHLMRSATIAGAFADAGWRVDLISGGMPIPTAEPAGVALHQLPPARAKDRNFSAILDEAGRPIDAAWKRRRADALMRLCAELEPDLLLLEHFPFGRRAFRFELAPLIEAARATADGPGVFASVRDVIVAQTPERASEIAGLIDAQFDGVLVHADPALIRLKHSFPRAVAIGHKLAYTGFVGGEYRPVFSGTDGTDEIVVSAGGGAVGDALTEAALATARTMGPARRWRLLIGHNAPGQRFEAWRAAAPGHVVVERARPDFRALLSRAALSISQAGYNTVVDVLFTGVRSILVPFATAKETEQTLRAERLMRKGIAFMLPEDGLSPATLTQAVATVLAAPPSRHAYKLDGALESERILKRWLLGRAKRG